MQLIKSWPVRSGLLAVLCLTSLSAFADQKALDAAKAAKERARAEAAAAANPPPAAVESLKVISRAQANAPVVVAEQCNSDSGSATPRKSVLRGTVSRVELRGTNLRSRLEGVRVGACQSGCSASIANQTTNGGKDEVAIDLQLTPEASVGNIGLDLIRAGRNERVADLVVVDPATVTRINPAQTLARDQVLRIEGRLLDQLNINVTPANCLTQLSRTAAAIELKNQCVARNTNDSVAVRLVDTRNNGGNCALQLPRIALAADAPVAVTPGAGAPGVKPDLKPFVGENGNGLPVRFVNGVMNLPPQVCANTNLPVEFDCSIEAGSPKDGVPDRSFCSGRPGSPTVGLSGAPLVWGVFNDSAVPVTTPFAIRLLRPDGSVMAQQEVPALAARARFTAIVSGNARALVAMRGVDGRCVQAAQRFRAVHGITAAVSEFPGDPQPLTVEVDVGNRIDEGAGENNNRANF